jgi:hypothetical protein
MKVKLFAEKVTSACENEKGEVKTHSALPLGTRPHPILRTGTVMKTINPELRPIVRTFKQRLTLNQRHHRMRWRKTLHFRTRKAEHTRPSFRLHSQKPWKCTLDRKFRVKY